MSMEDKINRCLDAVEDIKINMTKMEANIKINTHDLSTHIKRTDLLEVMLYRIYMAAYIGLGILVAKFGPDILKLIGL